MEYAWPGNVRELQNLVERELICYRGGSLSFDSPSPPERKGKGAVEQEPSSSKVMKLNELTRSYISDVLKYTKGKIHGSGGTAELLGLGANTLRARMDKLGIKYRKNEARE